MKKLITALLLVGIVLSGCGGKNEISSNVETETGVNANSDQKGGETSVLSSDNYEVNVAEMSYFFNVAYRNMATYASYFGLDTTKSLKEQECTIDSNGGTWYDFIANNAKDTASNMLSICEAAREAGVELDDEDMAVIDEQIAQFKSMAESSGIALEEYIKNACGKYTEEKDLRRIYELSLLASKYMQDVVEAADVSDDALEAYVNENPDNFTTVNYLNYTFDYRDIAGNDADDDAKASARTSVSDYASELAALTDAESFKAYIRNYAESVLGMSGDELEEEIASTERNNYSKADAGDDELTLWLFGAKAGETNSEVQNDGDNVAVVMVTREAGRDTAALKNVRHILFKSESYSDDTKVNEVYDKWVEDGKNKDDFIALVKEYSEDPGSVDNGGLYENVNRGDMVDEFNDWIFDEEREIGDSGIVKTSYGWHIMYFDGNGEQLVWQKSAEEAIRQKAYDDADASAAEKYTINVNEEGLGMLAD